MLSKERNQTVTGPDEIQAFGSAEAKRRQKADAAEFNRLRKENKRLALEVEILHKASAFFATRAVTTDSNHKLKPSPNLLEQKFHCQTPNTVWLVDITYNDTDEGWLYLAGIKNMATREIVGWAMEDHMRAELCYEALKMALGRRGPVPGLINHSDKRSQYAGGKYRELIGKAHLTQSMSRKGECLDNAPMESFFASLKKNWCTAVIPPKISGVQK
jgi:transposase InsO family protein